MSAPSWPSFTWLQIKVQQCHRRCWSDSGSWRRRRLHGGTIVLSIYLFLAGLANGDSLFMHLFSLIGAADTTGASLSADSSAASTPALSHGQNGTEVAGGNETTAGSTATTVMADTGQLLPNANAQEEEHRSSMAIFFILFVIVISILLIHVLLVNRLHYVPDSLAIVLLGAAIGAGVRLSNYEKELLVGLPFCSFTIDSKRRHSAPTPSSSCSCRRSSSSRATIYTRAISSRTSVLFSCLP